MKLIFAVTTCLLFSSKSWSIEGADFWKQKLFCENSCEETSYCKSKYMMVIHEARDSLGTERSILVIKKGHEGSEVSEESYGCSFKNHYLNCETDKMKISINIKQTPKISDYTTNDGLSYNTYTYEAQVTIAKLIGQMSSTGTCTTSIFKQ